tara:strand:- start:618 stop:1286 length:669 start_codon:yes stop_codon:yes gene_type:complete
MKQKKLSKNFEINLAELLNLLWKSKLKISHIIFVLTIVSFFSLQIINEYKQEYHIILKYELNLDLNKKETNEILSKYIKKKTGVILIFKEQHIEIMTNNELNFADIFYRSNEHLSNRILNEQLMEIDFLTKTYEEIGVKLEENDHYINSILSHRRLINQLNNGVKIYNFEEIKIIKINLLVQFIYSLIFSIVLSVSIETIFVIKKILKNHYKQTSSRKNLYN